MNLSDFKYLFTVTGGGWTEVREFWGIFKDNRVFLSPNVDSLNVNNLEYKFSLDEELDFEEHNTNVGFDAPICTMYKVVGNDVELLYSIGMYNNTPAVSKVRTINERYKIEELRNSSDNFVIGEVNDDKLSRDLILSIVNGNKFVPAIHAKSEDVKKMLSKVPEIDLYIGVSGAGKTYQLKHKVLDLISINSGIRNQYNICVVGRTDEWYMLSDIEFIDASQFKPEMLESLVLSQNTILVLDSIEMYSSDEFKSKLIDAVIKFRSNITSIILSCHSCDQIPTELIKNLHSVYIGKLFNPELIPLCDILGLDYKDYSTECLRFKKKELRGDIEDE